MARQWRALKRLVRLLWHVLHGVHLARTQLPQADAAQREQLVQRWAQEFLACAGVALRLEGPVPAGGPLLLVANHQSWLDIPSLHAAHACRFISKAELARWPLVGQLAQAARTLFIQRASRRDTQRTVQAMSEALQQGDLLAVFPEGTTGNGRDLLPFHGNLLQSAVDTDVAVQPVGLSFVDARTGAVSYEPCETYPEEPMLRSLWRTLQTEHLVAVVRYGQPEHHQQRDRRVWAKDLQARVHALRTPT